MGINDGAMIWCCYCVCDLRYLNSEMCVFVWYSDRHNRNYMWYSNSTFSLKCGTSTALFQYCMVLEKPFHNGILTAVL